MAAFAYHRKCRFRCFLWRLVLSCALEAQNSLSRKTAILIGVFAGFFSGMTGVGGGAILVSMMVVFLKTSQHKAHGTSLAIIVLVSLVGAIGYALPFLLGLPSKFVYQPELFISLAPTLAIASMFGVVLGAKIMTKLPALHLRRIFGIFLFFISFSMLTRGLIALGTLPGDIQPWPVVVWPVLGFVAGVASGILGIGGAMVMVPVMTLGAGIPQHMTQGITLAVITITTLTGAYTHYKLGNVDMQATTAIAPAAVVAGIISSYLATQIDPFWLTKIFGLAMLYFAFQFTFKNAAQRPTATQAAASEQKSADG